MPADVTDDAVLGGRLRLKQPKRGHRVGHDAILLAATCPAHAGERVVDLGAGVGAAGLALAARVAGIEVTLVEVDAELAGLATENAQLNGLVARVHAVVLDVAAPARAFAAARLGPESVERVLMNPPFNDPLRQRASSDSQRPLTMIWRAEGLAEVLNALELAFGAVTVLPVHGKAGEPAIRVLVRAAKASRAPLALLPGLVLADGSGRPTPEAEAVLRGGAALALAEC
jgi:tRNA1(Val) A37 N6-methylase TrmN6